MKTKEELEAEAKAYLERIRRTITKSNELISQAELRVAETDRLLESQGITREQLAAMKFSKEQKEAVNRELKRLGMEPLPDEDEEEAEFRRRRPLKVDEAMGEAHAPAANLDAGDTQGDMENRRRKFNVMMRQYKL